MRNVPRFWKKCAGGRLIREGGRGTYSERQQEAFAAAIASAQAAAAQAAARASGQAPEQEGEAPPMGAMESRLVPKPKDKASGDVARKLMAKMGWKEGQGLGRAEQGLQAPLSVQHAGGGVRGGGEFGGLRGIAC